jgi:hypothetical protein
VPVPVQRWPDGVRGIASGVRESGPAVLSFYAPCRVGCRSNAGRQMGLPESAYPAMVRVAPRSTTLAANHECYALNRLDAFCQILGSSFLVGWAADCALADERGLAHDS